MSVGQRIKERRIQLSMTQKQLGELCGMADSAIRKYESGRIQPKFETLVRIAKALGVRANDLLPQGVAIESEYEPPERLKRLFDLEEIFKQLNDEGQDLALAIIKELSAKPEYRIGIGYNYVYNNSDEVDFIVVSPHDMTNVLDSLDGE